MAQKSPEFLKARTLSAGMVRHILTVQPATSFEYRYESSGGDRRVIHLERGALESRGTQPKEVMAFRAGVSGLIEGDPPTRGGFFTSPDSIDLIEEAHLLIEGGVPGDSLICRSYGSWEGLRVTLTIYRENSDGSIERILQEAIQDADEHTYQIP